MAIETAPPLTGSLDCLPDHASPGAFAAKGEDAGKPGNWMPVVAPSSQPVNVINLLAYVHLRNIHASTGAGRVARQLTEHLAARSDVRLRILADGNDQARILPLVGEPWTSFDYHSFASDTSRQQAKWFAFDRPRAEAYWPEAQILFCTGESYVPTRSAKLVVTIHDAAYFEEGAHAPNGAFWKQKLKWKLLFDKLARKADLVHTVSQFSADRIAHFFPSMRSRIRVVPNGVAPHFFQPVRQAGRESLERLGLAETPFILVPGGLHYRKNAELILTAYPLLARRFPDLKVVVVNHSDAAYVARAARQGANLRMLGFVDDDALHALYSAAQLVWFPSRYEGFGLPVVEAMACGTPVVASNASSLPEICGNAALLVAPDDPEAHVVAIDRMLSDPGLSASLAEAGRQRAAGFTWAVAAACLKEHFDSLL